MKSQFLSIFTMLLSCFVSAQDIEIKYKVCTGCPQNADVNIPLSNPLFQYEDTSTYVAGDVESDFDLRRATGATRWHKGLDLRNHGQGADMQRGDAIVSPESGTIVLFQHTGYKYIVIDGDHDFGYGHIFSHHDVTGMSSWRSGNFVLKMSEPDQEGYTFPVIVNLNSCIAYCLRSDKTVVLSNNPHCSDTLITTNQVEEGAAFAPIGGSRGGANVQQDFPVHLHLYKFRDPAMGKSNTNCMDPLVDVQHPQVGFDLRLTFNHDIDPSSFSNWGETNLDYPGTDDNSIGLRATMQNAMPGVDSSRYINAVHNLDSVQLLVKRIDEDSFDVVFGAYYRSEFLLHAKDNTPLYPSNIVNHYGDENTTGVSPRAYQDGVGFRPYDNYYYADFLTRIHKDDPMDGDNSPTMYAYCPEEARYNDGVYLLKARVTTVRDSVYEEILPFNLDNYKPYVKDVEITLGTTLVYDKGWACDSSCDITGLVFEENLNVGAPTESDILSGSFFVAVETSEPLQWLYLTVATYASEQLHLVRSLIWPELCAEPKQR